MQILDKAEKKASHLIYMGMEYPHLDKLTSRNYLQHLNIGVQNCFLLTIWAFTYNSMKAKCEKSTSYWKRILPVWFSHYRNWPKLTGTDTNLEIDNEWHEAARFSLPPLACPVLHTSLLEAARTHHVCAHRLAGSSSGCPTWNSQAGSELQMLGKPWMESIDGIRPHAGWILCILIPAPTDLFQFK